MRSRPPPRVVDRELPLCERWRGDDHEDLHGVVDRSHDLLDEGLAALGRGR